MPFGGDGGAVGRQGADDAVGVRDEEGGTVVKEALVAVLIVGTAVEFGGSFFQCR